MWEEWEKKVKETTEKLDKKATKATAKVIATDDLPPPISKSKPRAIWVLLKGTKTLARRGRSKKVTIQVIDEVVALLSEVDLGLDSECHWEEVDEINSEGSDGYLDISGKVHHYVVRKPGEGRVLQSQK